MSNTDMTFDDYLAITRAFALCNRSIDDRNWEGLDRVFAIGATWIMADGAETKGLAAIKDRLRRFNHYLPYRFLHAVSNLELSFDGDIVNATSNWTYFVRKPPEGGPSMKTTVYDNAWYVGSIGTYQDILEKTDGAWLFTYRRIYNWEFSEPAIGK